MGERIFYKTILQIEILSEEPFHNENLNEIHDAITQGDCSGIVNEISHETLTEKETALALTAQGSEPGFFQIPDPEESP